MWHFCTLSMLGLKNHVLVGSGDAMNVPGVLGSLIPKRQAGLVSPAFAARHALAPVESQSANRAVLCGREAGLQRYRFDRRRCGGESASFRSNQRAHSLALSHGGDGV
jgi:hypothetical protein